MFKNYLLVIMLFCTGLATAQMPCDTVNMPIPQNWTNNCYPEATFFPGIIAGYITGVNGENFTQQANYFDLSSTNYSYVLGTVIKFSKANSNQPENISKMLYFRVFTDDNGKPGTEITTDQTLAQVPLSQIKSDAEAGVNTNINFQSPIALPASKKFYVSVDMSNFQWNPSENIRDSICISATGDNETKNAVWSFSPDASEWIPYPDYWTAPPDDIESLDVSLYIFPYVSVSTTGCMLLPVKLLSFVAEQKNHDVVLNWKVSEEMNMKGYEVEKAGSNGMYSAIKYLPAANSSKNQSYTVTDTDAFAGNTIVQYRLKQINMDGSIQFSEVVVLKSDGAGIAFQNPFTGTLQLRLNLLSPQTVTAAIYDMQGRFIAAERPVSYSAGMNTIRLNSTAALNTGIYILKMTAGKEQLTYKIIKQDF